MSVERATSPLDARLYTPPGGGRPPLLVYFHGGGCALADRDADGLTETARQAGSSVRVTQHVFDVTDAGAVAALPDAVLAAHGRVTVLVNCAGVSLLGRVEEVSLDGVRWLFEINFFAVVGLAKAFVPHLLRAGSPDRQRVEPVRADRPARAGGVRRVEVRRARFSEALRYELAGTTVGVTTVHLGGVRTGISRNARVAAAADADAERDRSAAFERHFLTTPPARVGEAVAKAVERRKPRLLVASGSRSGALLQRLFPAGYGRVLRLADRALPD